MNALPRYQLERRDNRLGVPALGVDFRVDIWQKSRRNYIYRSMDESKPQLVLKAFTERSWGERVIAAVEASTAARIDTAYIPVRAIVEGETPGYIMDCARGGSLLRQFHQRKIDAGARRRIALQLARTTQLLHARGFLIGDYNDANLFWNGTHVQICDPDFVGTVEDHNDPRFVGYAHCVAEMRNREQTQVYDWIREKHDACEEPLCGSQPDVTFSTTSDRESLAHLLEKIFLAARWIPNDAYTEEDPDAIRYSDRFYPAGVKSILQSWQSEERPASPTINDLIDTLWHSTR